MKTGGGWGWVGVWVGGRGVLGRSEDWGWVWSMAWGGGQYVLELVQVRLFCT